MQIKRVYSPYDATDGKRVLIDRLWPRGLARDGAFIDLWLKEIAPSTSLRRFFSHDPTRFQEFQRLYKEELTQDSRHQTEVQVLLSLIEEQPVTLLYAAKDDVHNHAVVLSSFLNECLHHR